MIKLSCLIDNCPLNNLPVDMRKCCGLRGQKPCQHYGAKPWEEFGFVSCNHPNALKATEEQKQVNREVFQATKGIGHILYLTI